MVRVEPFVVALVAGLALLPFAATDVRAQDDVPSPPPMGTVWTVFTTVEAQVHDNHATVRVIADIGNQGPDPEFPFQVQVPEGAYVTGLTIERDGEVYHAEIEEQAAARQAYAAHKALEETGGLVEKTRGHDVYAYLINVAEFTDVRATLTYEQYVAPLSGVHTFTLEAPVSGFGRDLGAAFEVTLDHTDGLLAAWSDPAGGPSVPEAGVQAFSYRVGPRPSDASTPFSVHYTIPGTQGAGTIVAYEQDGQGYFVQRLRAPENAASLPLDLVLVLDTSGSMGGTKIDQLKDAARQLIAGLDGDDRLHLALFSSGVRSPWSGMRPLEGATRDEAVDAVGAVVAGGGTNIHDAIQAGFQAYGAGDPERVPILIFLTDGLGARSATELRALAEQENDVSARVFSIAFGRDADWNLVAALAADGGGQALRVDEGAGAEVDITGFMTALTAPVLRDVQVTFDGDVEAYAIGGDTLFAGQELLRVGTFPAGQEALTGTLTARTENGTTSHRFETPVQHAGHPWLPRLVAAQQVRLLEGDLLLAPAGEAEAVRADLLALALEHGFVTDVTSLVVLLDHRDARPTCRDCLDDRTDVEAGRWRGDGAPVATWSGTSQPTSGSPPIATGSGAATTTEGMYYDLADQDGSDGVTRFYGSWNATGPGQESHDGPDAPSPLWIGVAALAGLVVLARRRL